MSVTLAVGGGLLVAGAAAARVYRGGTTLNDHAVAAVVTGCVAIYPLLWLGALDAGVDGWLRDVLAVVLAAGAASLYGLFHVLDSRRDPGVLVWVARLSQPAFAFSLWCGLLLLVRGPFAAVTGASLLWPGPLLAVPAGLALWGSAWTWLGHRDREHVVRIPGLAGTVRVAHLSDLHACAVMPRADLERLVARTNALAADFVVVTGDLLMPFSEQDHDYLIDALAGLRAPTFVCLGNHDLPVADTLVRELAAVGVRVLVDEAAIVEVPAGGGSGSAATGERGPPGGRCGGEPPAPRTNLPTVTVELVGVRFHWRDARKRLLDALDALPPATGEGGARVLLAHDPRLFAWVPDGRFDLVLSGHTHGGQVGTDMFGVPWSVLRPFGVYDQGRFTRGATQLWVHRGNWHTGLPPRMGIATEIVVHRLEPA